MPDRPPITTLCECGREYVGGSCFCGRVGPLWADYANGIFTCPVCNTTTQGKFCTECGAPSPYKDGNKEAKYEDFDPAPDLPNLRRCPCGNEFTGNFCPECGTPAGENAPVPWWIEDKLVGRYTEDDTLFQTPVGVTLGCSAALEIRRNGEITLALTDSAGTRLTYTGRAEYARTDNTVKLIRPACPASAWKSAYNVTLRRKVLATDAHFGESLLELTTPSTPAPEADPGMRMRMIKTGKKE